jgi:hypothetical protein
LAGAILAAAFFAGAFLAGAFLAGAFLAGALPDSTASLNAFNGVMRATRLALTFTISPVAGLRAMRAGRSMRRNLQNPEIATSSPLATVAVMRSVKPVNHSSASLRLTSLRSASAFSSWLRFTFPPSRNVGK